MLKFINNEGGRMSQVAFSVRMDSELKEKFEKLCEDLGMNMTTAFNIFARTVVREQRIPFEVSAARSNMVADSRAVYSATPANLGYSQESLEALLEMKKNEAFNALLKFKGCIPPTANVNEDLEAARSEKYDV